MLYNEFCLFLEKAVEPYTVEQTLVSMLTKHQFSHLKNGEKWEVKKGGCYYVEKGESALIGVKIGSKVANDAKIKIVAVHLDSPHLKIKPQGIVSLNHYTSLNTEVYGGLIYSSWLDRPLGIAGRIIVKEGNELVSKVVNLPCKVVIPNLAIHLNREINKGYIYNPQIDLLPLLDDHKSSQDFKEIVATLAEVENDKLVSYDLSLYVCEKPQVIGLNHDLIIAPRLDNLECTFTAITAFLNATAGENEINVFVAFNNEEVGSSTKQGADSTVLNDTLQRIIAGVLGNTESYYQMLEDAFMVSADNAHAIHPNLPQKTDPTNFVKLNEGIVIKHNANQRYTTDALSWAIIATFCEQANVKYQHYTNRSDLASGGTLGSISSTHLSINSVDIGCAQLAMHSAVETTGLNDFYEMYKLLSCFYTKPLMKVTRKD